TLQSRPPDQVSGAEVSCQGGELRAVLPWNGAAGTRVEGRHLFYNTPARRKFLRSAATEMGHVSQAFLRLALAPAGKPWTLRHTGRVVRDVRASMGLLDRIGLFCGTEVGGALYRVEAAAGDVRLEGYAADPSCDRGGTQLQYLFVNGRWVRDRGLFQAVQEAYRGLLLTGRYPVAFLFLRLPPEEVDVNAHPAKSEVRFRDRDGLHRLVLGAVRERLRQADLTARVRINGGKVYQPVAGANAGSAAGVAAPAPTAAAGPPPPPAAAPATPT